MKTITKEILDQTGLVELYSDTCEIAKELIFSAKKHETLYYDQVLETKMDQVFESLADLMRVIRAKINETGNE